MIRKDSVINGYRAMDGVIQIGPVTLGPTATARVRGGAAPTQPTTENDERGKAAVYMEGLNEMRKEFKKGKR